MRGAAPEAPVTPSSTGSGITAGRPQQAHGLLRAARLQAGDQVAEPLGAADVRSESASGVIRRTPGLSWRSAA
jgi:hypothetical protein